MFKTASADLVDLPLHRYIAIAGKPSIVATAMASIGEIEQVVDIYREAGNNDLVLLHCVANYPCSDASLNLKAMNTIQQTFDYPVGFSDHSVGSLAATLSIALGACVIQKHFTLDKTMAGPDHKASATPDELTELIAGVRRAEVMQGSPVKKRQQEEAQMSRVSRKSIVAAHDIVQGKLLTEDDLTLKRPGTGLLSRHLDDIVGKTAIRNIKNSKLISWHDVTEND